MHFLNISNSAGTAIEILVQAGLAESKANAKRLFEQGGVEINNKKITDGYVQISTLLKDNEALIQVGKRRFVKIKTEK